MKEIWDFRGVQTLEQLRKRLAFEREYHNRIIKYAIIDEGLINNIRMDLKKHIDSKKILKIEGIERVKLMR